MRTHVHLVLNLSRTVHVAFRRVKSGHTHHINNTLESITLSKLCAMLTVSSSECLAQAVVRRGLNRGLGTSLYHSSLVPSPTLGRWVWLPVHVYSKLGQHYVSGPRSGPAI